MKNKRTAIRKSVMIGGLVYIILTLIFLLEIYSTAVNNIIGLLVIVLSAYAVFKSKDNYLLLIISGFIAYSNYSIVVGIYFDPSLRPQYLYPQIDDIKVYGIGIALLLLFMILYTILIPKENKKINILFSKAFIRKENWNSVNYIVALIAYVTIMIFGYTRVAGGRGSSSAIYEYDVIFLIIMFFYSGEKKLTKWINVICSLLYVLTSLLNGTRIEALACIIIIFLCVVRKKIPFEAIWGSLIIGIVLFNYIGMFRGSYSTDSGGVKAALDNIIRNKLVFDTCLHAYFPMLAMIEKFMNYSFRNSAHFFLRFLLSVALGQARVSDSNLISYVREFYYHNFGGVSIGFFYVWFSFLGPAVFNLIIYIFIRNINIITVEKSSIYLCAVLYMAATVPRWYLYGPWSIMRGVLICLAVFFFFLQTERLLKHRFKR